MRFEVEGRRNDVVRLLSRGVVLRFGDTADAELAQRLLLGVVRDEIPVSRKKDEAVGLHGAHARPVALHAGIAEGHPLSGGEGVAQHLERAGLHFHAGRQWLGDWQEPDIPFELDDRSGSIGIEHGIAECAHARRGTAKRETLIGRDRQHRQRLIADPLRPRDGAHFERGHDARLAQREKGQVECAGKETIARLATVAVGQRLDRDTEGAQFVLIALEGAHDALLVDIASQIPRHIATQIGENGPVVAPQQRGEQIEPTGQFIGSSHAIHTRRTTDQHARRKPRRALGGLSG